MTECITIKSALLFSQMAIVGLVGNNSNSSTLAADAQFQLKTKTHMVLDICLGAIWQLAADVTPAITLRFVGIH
jgi:hypothetical protein